MKKYLISAAIVLVVLAVALAAFGQREGRETLRPGRPGEGRPGAMRPRGIGFEEQLKAIEAIEEQTARLKTSLGRQGRGRFQALSAEERARFSERWQNASEEERQQLRAQMRERFSAARRAAGGEERLEAIKAIEEQIAKLKGERQLRVEHQEAVAELKSILELAVKEKAEETAGRLEKLIAGRQKEFEAMLKKLRQVRPAGPARPSPQDRLLRRGPLEGGGRRWQNMSEEEREQLRARMRERFQRTREAEKPESKADKTDE